MSTQTFELFVAARYLRAKRKQAVISVITVISIVGVAAGVMALVIGLAINNGFRTTLQQSLLGTTAHVMLLNRQAAQGIANWKDLEPALRKLPHVTSVSPALYGKVLLTGPLGGAQADGAVLKGVPLEMPPDMLRHLKQGSFDDLFSERAWPRIQACCCIAWST
jgi:lipoprotein-releasing system permease protein